MPWQHRDRESVCFISCISHEIRFRMCMITVAITVLQDVELHILRRGGRRNTHKRSAGSAIYARSASSRAARWMTRDLVRNVHWLARIKFCSPQYKKV